MIKGKKKLEISDVRITGVQLSGDAENWEDARDNGRNGLPKTGATYELQILEIVPLRQIIEGQTIEQKQISETAPETGGKEVTWSTRQLSDHEIFDFLSMHIDVAQAVQTHEQMFLVDGHPYKWDQTLSHQTLTGIDGVLSLGVDVPIPPPGLAIKADPTYGNVVVFPDASGVLHFVSTDNTSLVNEIQKPMYVSDPEYWQMFQTLAEKFQESLPTLPQLGVGIGAVLLLAILLLARR